MNSINKIIFRVTFLMFYEITGFHTTKTHHYFIHTRLVNREKLKLSIIISPLTLVRVTILK